MFFSIGEKIIKQSYFLDNPCIFQATGDTMQTSIMFCSHLNGFKSFLREKSKLKSLLSAFKGFFSLCERFIGFIAK